MSTADSQAQSDLLPAIVVMGVSGSGKTSVGRLVAVGLDAKFVEGDELHPDENVRKMARGVPLDDDDRWPWLERVAARLRESASNGRGVVIGCSALKRSYRDLLRREAGRPITFLYLEGGHDLLKDRLSHRSGHFMPTSLLDSQFDALEDPTGEPDVVVVSVDQTLDGVVRDSLKKLRAA